MSRQRLLAGFVAVSLVAWYGLRAAAAIGRAPAHAAGRRAFAEGRFTEAVPALHRAAADGRRAAQLWYAGQAVLQVYRGRVAERAPDTVLDALLATADRDFTEAITRSPASGWYWVGFSEVYHERERRARAREGVPLALFTERPLASLGRDGRVALGALRLALRREPTTFAFHDQLALVYFDYHLEALALAAVRDAARMQPLLDMHGFAALDPAPPGFLDAFADGARAALHDTPLLRPVDHHIALGRVELQRGRYEDALREFDQALASPRPALQDAEARYHRSTAFERLGRIDAARTDLATAGRHPVFVRPALARQAGIAERAGDLEAALGYLGSLRRLDPADLDTLLWFSNIATRLGRLSEAHQALAWAETRHPSSPRPLVGLVDVGLLSRDLALSEQALLSLERLDPEHAELSRLRQAVDAARGR